MAIIRNLRYTKTILIMKKLLTMRTAILVCLMSLPTLVLAQAITGADVKSGINSFGDIVTLLTNKVVTSLATLLLSLGLLAFFWGIVQFIIGSRNGEEKAITAGKQFMGWGLVGLFVMFSVYGIIKLSQSIFFGGKDITTITIPEVNFGKKVNTTTGTGEPLPTGKNIQAACVAAGGTWNVSGECVGGSSSMNGTCTSSNLGAACGTGKTCAYTAEDGYYCSTVNVGGSSSMNGTCTSSNLGAACGTGKTCAYTAEDGYYCSTVNSAERTSGACSGGAKCFDVPDDY